MLAAFGIEPGFRRDTAFRLASAFGGGMGRTGNVCGVVTGAIMVIGLKHGTADLKSRRRKEKANRLAREFMEKFRSLNGSLLCKELLGYEIGKDKPKGDKTVCPKLVKDASEILEGML